MKKWELKNISDEAYFATGDISKEMSPIDSHKKLVVSNSYVKVFKTNLYHELLFGDNEVDKELQEIFDTGSGFHAYVLENKEFYKRYHVTDSVDSSRDTIRISASNFNFIETAYKNIAYKYPNIIDGLNVELAIFGEIDGVPVKCKIDKLNIKQTPSGKFTHVEIVDLKSVYFKPFSLKKDMSGERRKLRYMLSDVGYDIQDYFYTTMVEHWLESIGQHCTVSFALLTASKENNEVQKFRLGSEMYESGKMKFESVWGEIRDFVLYGKDRLNDEEVLLGLKRRLKKINGALVGFDSEAEEALKRLPTDTLLYYDITNPRNGEFHKKLFAMFNIIKDNYHEKVSVEEILIYVKDELNMWEVVKLGKTHYKRYESISFDKMEEDSFADFYDKAIDVCMLLVPIDRDDLAYQVAKFGSR